MIPPRDKQALRDAVRHPHFWLAAREMLGAGLGLSAWGLVTGVAMVKAGLSVPLALLMSFTVFAGSAQLAALPMLAVHAPIWVIWAAGFCVNLRFVIFSAQWRPVLKRFPRWQRMAMTYFCADMLFVVFMKRFYPAHGEGEPEAVQFPYFLGSAATNWVTWQVPAVAGILLADVVPTQWGLGFAGVLALLGLTYSLLSDRVTVLSALVAGSAAVAAFALPLRLNIVVAIVAGVVVGLVMDAGEDAARRVRVDGD